MTLSAPGAVVAGTAMRLRGNVTRRTSGTQTPAAGIAVRVYLRPAARAPQKLLGATKTGPDGSFSLLVRPTEHGDLVAAVVGVAGYNAAESRAASLSVGTRITLTGPRPARRGVAFRLAGQVSVGRVTTVVLQRSSDGLRWADIAVRKTSASGAVTFADTRVRRGRAYYRVRAVGDARGNAGVSAPVTVTILGGG